MNDKDSSMGTTIGLLILIAGIFFVSCIFSNACGRASQRAEMENFDVYRIHTSFRETEHYKYCPYCGKELVE